MQPGRRTVLGGIATGVAALIGGGSALAHRGGRPGVSESDVRDAARATVERIAGRVEGPEWQSPTLGEGVTFFASDKGCDDGSSSSYSRTAQVFTVHDGGAPAGYVTAAARHDWTPILEYSAAMSPARLLDAARSDARGQGFEPTGRLLYHGGVKYGLELAGGRAMNLRDGRITDVRGYDPASMSFDPETVERRWTDLGDATGSTGGATEASSGQWSDTLHDVPAWEENDEGKKDSTSYGPKGDAWSEWDGCSPVAGSMIVAYHEDKDEQDTWYQEYYIDKLHESMDTDYGGETKPWNIDDGFDDFDGGSHSYNGRNIYSWYHPNFVKSEISDNERPFQLNMRNGGCANDRDRDYGEHSVVVVGYTDDGETFKIHDGWDDEIHYLSWGAWSECMYTKVTIS